MLPIIDTPTIQYVVQEAIDSGIDDILIISGKGKRAIEDHFDRNAELEMQLEGKKDQDMYNEILRISDMANIHYIRQKQLNGLGDAIYQARLHTADEPFAVLLGDTLVQSIIPATQQLIDIYEQYRQTIVGVEVVPREKVSRYGIVGGDKISDSVFNITELVEKPSPETSPSELAIAGRYILMPEIFEALERTEPDANGEVQLTDALRILLQRERIISHTIEGKRYDIGNKLDFLKTTVEFALKRKEFEEPFGQFLQEIVGRSGKKES